MTNKMTAKSIQLCVSFFYSFPHLPNCSISLAINASEEPGFSRSIFTKALETLCPTDPFEVSPPTAYIIRSFSQNTKTFFSKSKQTLYLLREGRLPNVRRLEIRNSPLSGMVRAIVTMMQIMMPIQTHLHHHSLVAILWVVFVYQNHRGNFCNVIISGHK